MGFLDSTLIATALIVLISSFLFSKMFGFGKKWDPKGLHVYITGGSQGLGLSAAIMLAKKGAHISIVARRKEFLDRAIAEIEAARVSPDQKFHAYSFSLGTYSDSKAALDAVCQPYGGQVPDCILNCAGGSKPQWWVDMTEQDMIKGMEMAYWVEAWTTMIASQLMVKQKKVGGKIVLVSSIVGYMTIQGYGSYAPAKTALRSLCDTLDSELLLYGIDVHCFFPPTMYTPGYEEELKTKPGPQRKIEEDDQALTPDQAAAIMIKGIESGTKHISGNFITDIFRACTRGSARPQNYLMDAVLDAIGFIVIPIWRWTADRTVMSYKESHFKDLETRGYFEPPPQSNSP